MIALIEGRLLEKTKDSVVVSAGGVGYRIFVPTGTLAGLPEAGQAVSLFTHLHVREELLQLYGFLTRQERVMFERLISVSGVGPRVALAALSSMNPERLVMAVEQSQASLLSGIPGIGKKTAERLVFELKGKLTDLVRLEAVSAIGGAGEEAVSALVSLGYSGAQAESAVRKALEDAGDRVDSGELVRRALTRI
ncbi:MAG: Holliday junction branch migration protein RuvA [Candidatus Glassbacteria bacterium]|nr:Holliday junction branch migration protein RuvA [Candidatus Glassbacteria bacterium]